MERPHCSSVEFFFTFHIFAWQWTKSLMKRPRFAWMSFPTTTNMVWTRVAFGFRCHWVLYLQQTKPISCQTNFLPPNSSHSRGPRVTTTQPPTFDQVNRPWRIMRLSPRQNASMSLWLHSHSDIWYILSAISKAKNQFGLKCHQRNICSRKISAKKRVQIQMQKYVCLLARMTRFDRK